MLLLSNKLLNTSILSLRTGGQIAQTYAYLVNPDNLKIEGFHCHVRSDKQDHILLHQDIRNIIDQGIIINDHDVLSAPGDLIRLKDIINLNFSLIGKSVVTSSKHKVGKVKDFAFDSTSFYVQKLYVSQSVIKNLGTSQLSIDRSQIVEVTDTKIIIHELVETAKVKSPAAVPAPSSAGSSA